MTAAVQMLDEALTAINQVDHEQEEAARLAKIAAVELFWSTTKRIADGAKIEPGELRKILADAGKTGDDMRAEVKRIVRRRELFVMKESLQPLAGEINKRTARINAQAARHAEAVAAFESAQATLIAERDELQARLDTLPGILSELAETADPELRAKHREAHENRSLAVRGVHRMRDEMSLIGSNHQYTLQQHERHLVALYEFEHALDQANLEIAELESQMDGEPQASVVAETDRRGLLLFIIGTYDAGLVRLKSRQEDVVQKMGAKTIRRDRTGWEPLGPDGKPVVRYEQMSPARKNELQSQLDAIESERQAIEAAKRQATLDLHAMDAEPAADAAAAQDHTETDTET